MIENLNRDIKSAFEKSYQNLKNLSENENFIRKLSEACEVICYAYEKGGCLFAAGNGGSAADAQHLIAELVSKLNKDRTPIRGFALTTDTSILTAIGNDYGYSKVFERQVLANMKKEDVLLAITTSGNSENIVLALKACKEIGAKSILLAGRDGGRCAPLADLCLIANGDNTANIQESHLVIYHTLCWLIEKQLVARGMVSYV